MARPPYLRWLAAAAIIAIGIAFEVSGRATAPHPYLVGTTRAGETITDDRIEWRDVPVGFLEAPDLAGAVAAVDLPANTPLIAALLRAVTVVPAGWVAVPVPLPAAALNGTEVELVLTATGRTVEGRVVAGATGSGFGFDEPGLVAVPPDQVAAVATAAASSDLVVAIRLSP